VLQRLPYRGGNWNNSSNAGLAARNLNNERSNTNSNIGFRPALNDCPKQRGHGFADSASIKRALSPHPQGEKYTGSRRLVGAPSAFGCRPKQSKGFEVKTYNNLYPSIYELENLHNAYLKARLGKRERTEVLRFERDLEGNLIRLQEHLVNETYTTGQYRKFYVHEPKHRLVAALPFRDRVTQHALISVIEPIWERRFIHHSYACRPGRGMHKGSTQAQQWLREVQRQHGTAYCLKADVSKYFASIDQDVLGGILSRKIACQPTLNLCKNIMASWPQGLPIGNLTSQLWANIYLHELDAMVKHELRIHRYIRYMDDFVIIHHDKSYLKAVLNTITEFLNNALKLRLNNKTQIFPVSQNNGRALDFLGYRTWPTHKRIRKDSVKRMNKKMKKMARLYATGDIDHDYIKRRIVSWVGHAQYADSYRIRNKVLGSVTFKREG